PSWDGTSIASRGPAGRCAKPASPSPGTARAARLRHPAPSLNSLLRRLDAHAQLSVVVVVVARATLVVPLQSSLPERIRVCEAEEESRRARRGLDGPIFAVADEERLANSGGERSKPRGVGETQRA